MAWVDKNGNEFESVRDAAIYECEKHAKCIKCRLLCFDYGCLITLHDEAEIIEKLELVPFEEKTMNDNVNHPAHYTQGGIECIEAIKASMTPSEYEGYLKGNVLKYLWRWRDKGGVESLCKGRWYLNKLIESQEVDNDERMGS